MRRLADLKLEKEFGVFGDGSGALVELPAPETGAVKNEARERKRVADVADHSESERDFERRAASDTGMPQTEQRADLESPGGENVESSGPLEAIALYDDLLATYPNYHHNDQVLYQKARAYGELGRSDEAISVIERLISEYPHSGYIDEVQFRRAEYFFVRRNYFEAEHAYSAITTQGVSSDYYELALYKLGWALYKQELHEEALTEYVALLDYKVSTGYDFDQSEDVAAERRVADTYRVISLSFSNLGGPEVVEKYFAANGHRSYEDRIYSHLGEFYLEKLRYNDAATSYKTFVGLHPLHRVSPHFSMRVIEIYEAGAFPILVLESKKEFAVNYGLQSEYWRHFDVDDSPQVMSYLKSDLEDLATHYHALYQEPELPEEKPANFEEALHWYRAYLASFPADVESPGVNHQLADLLLEHEDFGEAAREYERTAYTYPENEKGRSAGYAAIYAHREHQKAASDTEKSSVRREAVASTLRFVDAFPDHEQAAVVMGAAVDDLYDMKEFDHAIATGQRLIEIYPEADPSILRSAWTAIAHSFFDIVDFVHAEQAYERVLQMTSAGAESLQSIVDNLAAAIYKQGEEANLAADYRSAADHFLRITKAAPTSEIRPAAEYDAGIALVRLEDWSGAATVLETFRETHPDHELQGEATKQIASVRREEGDLSARRPGVRARCPRSRQCRAARRGDASRGRVVRRIRGDGSHSEGVSGVRRRISQANRDCGRNALQHRRDLPEDPKTRPRTTSSCGRSSRPTKPRVQTAPIAPGIWQRAPRWFFRRISTSGSPRSNSLSLSKRTCRKSSSEWMRRSRNSPVSWNTESQKSPPRPPSIWPRSTPTSAEH